jgi:Flp pilus assembly protein TadG
MKKLISLRRDDGGAAVIEMAIALPVLVTFIWGIFQIGIAGQAIAGMQHGLGEGARYATLCLNPTSNGTCTMPSATQIAARVNSKLFGTNTGTFYTPTVDTTTASSGYITLSIRYTQALNFLFFMGPTVDITRSKRVYLANSPPSSTACSSPPSGTTAPASCSIYL